MAEEGRKGSYYLMGTGFQFEKMKKVCSLDNADGVRIRNVIDLYT